MADAQWRYGTDLIYTDPTSTNVGIGITEPSSQLHVAGHIYTEANIYLKNSAGNKKLFVNHNDGGSYAILNPVEGLAFLIADGRTYVANAELAPNTDNNEGLGNDSYRWNRLKVGTGTSYFQGNVGIGTTTPGAKLDVRGSAIFNEDGGDNDFRVEGDTEQNLLFIDASADKIGIGTNNPASLLDLGSGEHTGYLQKFLLLHAGNARSGWGHDYYEDRLFFPTDGHMSFGTISLTDGSTWAELMRLTNSGNVGIGETNPQSKLDVGGAVVIGANYSGTYAAPSDGLRVEGDVVIGSSGASGGNKLVVFGYINGHYAAVIQNLEDSANSHGLYVSSNNADSYALRVVRNSNDVFCVCGSDRVGIGTNSPEAKLDVNGALVIRTVDTPSNPPSGCVVIWFDGTDIKAKKSNGQISTLSGGWS